VINEKTTIPIDLLILYFYKTIKLQRDMGAKMTTKTKTKTKTKIKVKETKEKRYSPHF